jgi:PTS system mannose-specific IIA component
MQRGTVEVIAGMNVPMLIKLAELRETTSVSDAVRQAQDAGRKYIAVASALLDVGA